MSTKGKRNEHEWGVVFQGETAIGAWVEIAYCELCRKYKVYGKDSYSDKLIGAREYNKLVEGRTNVLHMVS